MFSDRLKLVEVCTRTSSYQKMKKKKKKKGVLVKLTPWFPSAFVTPCQNQWCRFNDMMMEVYHIIVDHRRLITGWGWINNTYDCWWQCYGPKEWAWRPNKRGPSKKTERIFSHVWVGSDPGPVKVKIQQYQLRVHTCWCLLLSRIDTCETIEMDLSILPRPP